MPSHPAASLQRATSITFCRYRFCSTAVDCGEVEKTETPRPFSVFFLLSFLVFLEIIVRSSAFTCWLPRGSVYSQLLLRDFSDPAEWTRRQRRDSSRNRWRRRSRFFRIHQSRRSCPCSQVPLNCMPTRVLVESRKRCVPAAICALRGRLLPGAGRCGPGLTSRHSRRSRRSDRTYTSRLARCQLRPAECRNELRTRSPDPSLASLPDRFFPNCTRSSTAVCPRVLCGVPPFP